MRGSEKWLKLSHKELTDTFSYCQETGEFRWKVKRRRMNPGDRAGRISGSKYETVRMMNTHYAAHRLAIFYVTGALVPAEMDVDHIDNNPKNNAYKNLRVISHRGNMQNQVKAHKRLGSTSQFLGVSWKMSKKKWRACLADENGRHKHLGYFDTEQEAHQAYLKAKRSIHEGNTL